MHRLVVWSATLYNLTLLSLSDDVDDCQGNIPFVVAQRIWVGKSLSLTNEINNYERKGEPAKPVNV